MYRCFVGFCTFYWPAGFTWRVHEVFAWYFGYSIRTTGPIFPSVLLSIWRAEFCHGHTTAGTNGQSKFWFPFLLLFPFLSATFVYVLFQDFFVKRICSFLSFSNVVETGLPLLKQIGLWALTIVTWTTIKLCWNCKRIRGSVWRKIAGREEIVITITENLSMIAIGNSVFNTLMTKGNLPGRWKTLEGVLIWPLMMTKMPWDVSCYSTYDSKKMP